MNNTDRRNINQPISFTVIYPNMIVHRTGCPDIAKIPNLHPDTTVVRQAATVEALLADELAVDLGEMGYTPDDYTVKPCAWDAVER